MLIEYARVSKADGSQSLDLQRDALLAAGVDERHLHQDRVPALGMIGQAWPPASSLCVPEISS